MNEPQKCPGCPECKPARSTEPPAGPGTAYPLSRDQFDAMLGAAYERYVRLPEQDQEFFDARSYCAGLEHGYCERDRSVDSSASISALFFFTVAAAALLVAFLKP